MVWFANATLKAYENCSFDLYLDGEAEVLKRLASVTELKVVFDVGANHGDWTDLALRNFPKATVHCFELARPVFSILQRKFRGRANVRLNPFGLADRDGDIRVAFSANNDGLTSLMTALDQEPSRSVIDAEIRTGDGYFADNQLVLVDLIKVDVEGAELLVFAGFDEALTARRFRCVQFEYGHSGLSLREYYQFFETRGYMVGKIFPDGCDFGPYWSPREQIASNYIAVRNDEQAIIGALQARP